MPRHQKLVPALLGLLLMTSCVANTEDVSASNEALFSGPFAYLTVRTPFTAGFQVHGVTINRSLYFALQPSDVDGSAKGVHVGLRGGGLLGDFVAPSGGWDTPLSIKTEHTTLLPLGGVEGTVLVLDAGVVPANMGMAPARLIRYGFRYTLWQGLSTWVQDEHYLPLDTLPPPNFPNGLVYPGSIALLPGGRVAVTGTATGTVWVSDASLDNWTMGLFDARFMARPGDPIVGRGFDRDYVMLPPVYPGAFGIVYADVTDEVCFSVAASPGGIYCVPLGTLDDPSVPPFAKSGFVRELVPPTPGVSEYTNGMTYIHGQLYWVRAPADALSNWTTCLRRVSLTNGEVQSVLCDERFSWVSEIDVMEGVLEHSLVFEASDGQEYNNGDVNLGCYSASGEPTCSFFSPTRRLTVHAFGLDE